MTTDPSNDLDPAASEPLELEPQDDGRDPEPDVEGIDPDAPDDEPDAAGDAPDPEQAEG